MDTVTLDFTQDAGPMKDLHGVNNAPVRPWKGAELPEFRDAGFPYVRTHDTARMWGGKHYVDIPNVFPDFDADENDPAAYDFAFTDAYLKPIVEAGAKPFYRLGVTIENYHRVKTYNIDPPKDFAKWARICEHIIRHYNEGWADGFRWGLEYWEIWCEPENPPLWQGTREQFYELYRITANHLKSCFPDIKVGGFGGCGFYAYDDPERAKDKFYYSFITWFEEFLDYVQAPATKAPLDFYSWHIYTDAIHGPERIITHAKYVRERLDAAGLTETESFLDEWNDCSDAWAGRGFETMKEMPGATTITAAICLMQHGPVDKAMYYDALPTRSYCGLFYYPSERVTPTYRALQCFNALYRLGTSTRVEAVGANLYALAARTPDGADKAFLFVNRRDEPVSFKPAIAGAEGDTFTLRLLDADHPETAVTGTFSPGDIVPLPAKSILLATTEAEPIPASSFSPAPPPPRPVPAPVQGAVEINFDNATGPVKPLHGINNPPVRPWKDAEQPELKEAGIPIVRTSDTSGEWGGTHYIDIPNLFPDFDADENDPASYDFAFTDGLLKAIVESGAAPLYRLGVTIEDYWEVKAYEIFPPKDPAKWARICEHIIRHYNAGWAGGFNWDIQYWEIWNGPESPSLWHGTRGQFFELYRITANHLKSCFPGIKVGGYGSCGFELHDDPDTQPHRKANSTWFEEFLGYIQAPATQAPLDFFSWHHYIEAPHGPERIAAHARHVRERLDAARLDKTEIILDEWNDCTDAWSGRGFDSMKEMPGATTAAAALCVMQMSAVDKAMYYDGQPGSRYGGLFYFPSGRVTPTYRAFQAFNALYRLGTAVRLRTEGAGLYACAARDGDRQAFLLVNRGEAEMRLRPALAGAAGAFQLRVLDASRRELAVSGSFRPGDELALPPQTILLATTDGAPVAAPAAEVRPTFNAAGLDNSGRKQPKSKKERT